MIKVFIVGFIAGAISMFLVIRNGYVSVKKKKRTPKDLELGKR
jgi:hypothetical protein